MKVRNTRANAIGTHAPCRNLIREAEKKRASMVPNMKTNPSARRTFWCQHSTITSDIKQVVTSITVITAKPVVQSKVCHILVRKNKKIPLTLLSPFLVMIPAQKENMSACIKLASELHSSPEKLQLHLKKECS